jgi:hypothetical protein
MAISASKQKGSAEGDVRFPWRLTPYAACLPEPLLSFISLLPPAFPACLGLRARELRDLQSQGRSWRWRWSWSRLLLRSKTGLLYLYGYGYGYGQMYTATDKDTVKWIWTALANSLEISREFWNVLGRFSNVLGRFSNVLECSGVFFCILVKMIQSKPSPFHVIYKLLLVCKSNVYGYEYSQMDLDCISK